MNTSQDLIVSIRRRSLGLTIADVRPCIIAIATNAESMIGRMFFGIPLLLLDRPPVEFSPISENILIGISGEGKKNLTVEHLLEMFEKASGSKLENDRMLLSKDK